VVGEGRVGAETLLPAQFALDEARLLGFGFLEEVGCGLPEVFDLFWRVLAEGAKGKAVDGNEGVVGDDVDSVTVAKVGVEAIAYADLDSSCKAQVMVSWQAADDLSSLLSGSRF
jgi:hypothetical protein